MAMTVYYKIKDGLFFLLATSAIAENNIEHTPFLTAVYKKHWEKAYFLLEHGTTDTFCVKDTKGNSPLFHVVRLNALEILEKMLAKPEVLACLNQKNAGGKTTLYSADIKAALLLLEAGADTSDLEPVQKAILLTSRFLSGIFSSVPAKISAAIGVTIVLFESGWRVGWRIGDAIAHFIERPRSSYKPKPNTTPSYGVPSLDHEKINRDFEARGSAATAATAIAGPGGGSTTVVVPAAAAAAAAARPAVQSIGSATDMLNRTRRDIRRGRATTDQIIALIDALNASLAEHGPREDRSILAHARGALNELNRYYNNDREDWQSVCERCNEVLIAHDALWNGSAQ